MFDFSALLSKEFRKQRQHDASMSIDNPEIPDPFLLEDWLDADGEFVESYVDNEKAGWTGEQIWGFATINGERRHVRRVIVKKGDTALKVRLVYDWQGKGE